MGDDVNIPDQAFDISRPSPARMYDALLGGKDNYAADREAAEQLAVKAPEVYEAVRENRSFLVRAVRFLADQGIRQYVDLGSGLPTSPNVHEVAQQVHRDARVAYVDNDPVVAAHMRARLAGQTTRIVPADLRDPEAIVNNPDLRELINLREPVAVLAVAVLHFLDDRDGLTLVARLRQVMAPGSWLVVTHASPGTRSHRDITDAADTYRRTTADIWVRTPEQIRCYFTGLELAEPGLVPVQDWRPELMRPDLVLARPRLRPLTSNDEPSGPRGVFLAGIARTPRGRDG